MSRVREIAADVLLVAGVGSVTAGAWLIYEPLAWIAGGVGLGMLSWMLGRQE